MIALPEKAEQRVEIGRVVAVNPAKREIRVELKDRNRRYLKDCRWIRLAMGKTQEMRCAVAKSRPDPTPAIVTLAAGVTRDSVSQMKGAKVMILESELVAPSLDDFDPQDLLGFQALTGKTQRIGAITALFETKANYVLEIEKSAGGMILLPLIPQVIDHIDWDGRKILLNDIAPFIVDEGDDGERWA